MLPDDFKQKFPIPSYRTLYDRARELGLRILVSYDECACGRPKYVLNVVDGDESVFGGSGHSLEQIASHLFAHFQAHL